MMMMKKKMMMMMMLMQLLIVHCLQCVFHLFIAQTKMDNLQAHNMLCQY